MKTQLISTMGDKCLSSLVILSIERDLSSSIRTSHVLDNFASNVVIKEFFHDKTIYSIVDLLLSIFNYIITIQSHVMMCYFICHDNFK